MGRLPTSIVRDAHAYTRSKTPWLLDAYHKKLFHYLSGGGLRSFGRTVEQEETEAKRTRFLVRSAIALALWFWFWI